MLFEKSSLIEQSYARTKKKRNKMAHIFFGLCPIWLPIFFISFQLNEPGLGAGIDPGIALTLFPSSIGFEPTTLNGPHFIKIKIL